MKTRLFAFLVLAFLSAFSFHLSSLYAQGTAFTYQGQLQNNGSPASGTYNLTFTLFNTNTAGVPVAGPVTNNSVVVTNGLFTVTLDFGGVFTGTSYWLEIGARTNGNGAFTTLTPRQELTPAPYAIFAEGANAAGLSGTIPMSNLTGTYGGALSLTNAANSFTGNGSGLTGVNAATLGGLAAGSFWQVGGNTGVPTGSNFIGNTDNQFLDLHANGVRAMRLRLLSDGLGLYSNAPNVIGGSAVNLTAVNVVGATIAGGGGNSTNGFPFINDVTADFGTIGGGAANTAGRNATVSGGYGNNAGGIGSFIGGGGYDGNIFPGNSVQDNAATIGGGLGNYIPSGGAYSSIGGGYFNTAAVAYSTIGGGYHNTASNAYVFVGGGFQNNASGPLATVAGGGNNTASWGFATVGGGLGNAASGNSSGYSTICGGESNSASGDFSFIGGGALNLLVANYSTIGGGYGNIASFPYAVVGGGYENVADGSYSTVAGGVSNRASGFGSFIGGGGYSITNPVFSANVANAASSTIGGGSGNTISSGGLFAFIGGGAGNLASSDWATVAGGAGNTASDQDATVSGGANNIASNPSSTVGGGEGNEASGDTSTVTGGTLNTASGILATVCGGTLNTASGPSSFAAGTQAIASQRGSFVWADSLTYDFDPFTQSGPEGIANSFNVRSTGGFYIATAISTATGNVTAGAYLAAGGSGWNVLSDRNAKTDFERPDPRGILDRLVQVPVLGWNYKSQDSSTRHIGPMAQDFNAAFGVGEPDKTGERKYINSLDEEGVALAAIQGLNQKLNEKDAEIQKLKEKADKVDSLEKRLNELEQMVQSLAVNE
jgi:hypothetical protein